MRVLITGATGAAGSYFIDYLREFHHDEVEVWGLSRWHSTGSHKNLSASADFVRLIECDLTDLSSVIHSLKTSKPDLVMHFASHANVRASFDTPLAVVQNNAISTLNLLEGLRILEMRPKFILSSTSEVYGHVSEKDIPIKESQIMHPVSPYAASKAFQDHISLVYYEAFGIPVIRTRMFTYVNARRSDLFATAWAKQIVAIERGEINELRHGNLDSVRTLIDVRDAMSAYWETFLKCVPGEVYNIGGTEVFSVGEVLSILVEMAKVPIKTSLDPNLLRPKDVTLQVPDCSKFIAATGWKTKYSIQDSLGQLLDELRTR